MHRLPEQGGPSAMSPPRFRWLAAAAALLVFALAGCGTSTPPADTTPFEAAIHSYLGDHQMGLKVAQFKELKVEGAKATAVVSLEHAEGMVGVKVRWTFEFEQHNGRWAAVRHKQ